MVDYRNKKVTLYFDDKGHMYDMIVSVNKVNKYAIPNKESKN